MVVNRTSYAKIKWCYVFHTSATAWHQQHSKNVTHKIACMLDLYQHLSNKTMSFASAKSETWAPSGTSQVN